MEDFLNNKGLCNVCREEYTTIHAEVALGQRVFVCKKCLEMAKENFIWICMQCGSVHIRSKSLILKRLADPELKRAYTLCENMQLIQGVDMCVDCDPEGIVEFATAAKCAKHSGFC